MSSCGGVLADLDGTLVDSNYHHTIAWSRALQEHGEQVALADIHRSIGMGSFEMLHSLVGRFDEGIVNSWRFHFGSLLSEVVPFRGAAELLEAFHARGLKVVIATSSPEDLLRELVKRLDP